MREAAPVSRLAVRRDNWPLAKPFTISRGSKTVAEVVVAEIAGGALRGRGEGVPYARYGETIEGVVAALGAMNEAVAGDIDTATLLRAIPPSHRLSSLLPNPSIHHTHPH